MKTAEAFLSSANRRALSSPLLLLTLLTTALIIAASAPFAFAQERSVTAEFDPRTTTDARSFQVPFDDDWFAQSPYNYNHKLAQASIGLAVSAARDDDVPLGQQEHRAITLLSQAGFTNFSSGDYDQDPTPTSMASLIASKNVGGITLVAVALCGGNYGAEWSSNVTMGDAIRHEGFDASAKRVEQRITDYLATIKGPKKLWIVGYSRAAAVANLVAADMISQRSFDGVFAYTFATPANTRSIDDPSKYACIFNIIGKFDPVPAVPLKEWGFMRYGTTLYRPAPETDINFAQVAPAASKVLEDLTGQPLRADVTTDMVIRTLLEHFSLAVSTSSDYQQNLQDAMSKIFAGNISPKTLTELAKSLINAQANSPEEKARYRALGEYLLNVAALSVQERNYGWESGIGSFFDNPLMLMYEHFEEVTVAWVLGLPDGSAFNDKTEYTRVHIDGDIDVVAYGPNMSITRINAGDDRPTHDQEDAGIAAARIKDATVLCVPQGVPCGLGLTSREEQTISCFAANYSDETLHAQNPQSIDIESPENGVYYLAVLGDGRLAEWDSNLTQVQNWDKSDKTSPDQVLERENDNLLSFTLGQFAAIAGALGGFVVVLLVAVVAGIIVLVRRRIKRHKDGSNRG